MPNWCINILTVSGPSWQKFDEAFQGPRTVWGENLDGDSLLTLSVPPEEYVKIREYCFNALYPVPIEVMARGYDNYELFRKPHPATTFYKRLSRLAELYGKSYTTDEIVHLLLNIDKIPCGYDWQKTHWGTKWDVTNVVVEFFSEEQVCYRFDTAWAPPLGWIKMVAIDWPDLTFTIRYFEPGMCYAGEVVLQEGHIISDVFYRYGHDYKDYRRFVEEYFGTNWFDYKEE